jgi:hypothetical protein
VAEAPEHRCDSGGGTAALNERGILTYPLGVIGTGVQYRKPAFVRRNHDATLSDACRLAGERPSNLLPSVCQSEMLHVSAKAAPDGLCASGTVRCRQHLKFSN